ncbi:MAG: Ig-like domain-containing protein, partial [Candidatus Hatepunaea meridiana]|nr:Ig-like domain-containing protein [Candidatus Hatepunaea meridiana]
IAITVNNVNRAPVLTAIGNLEIDEEEEFTLQLEANDQDGDNLSYEAENLPQGATLEGSLFSWTPDADQAGVYEGIIFRVQDDGSPQLSVEETITITVYEVNHEPVLSSIGNMVVNEDTEYTRQLTATDPDGNNLTFEAENLPEGATLNGDRFSWTPDFDQAGVYNGIIFRVWDDGDPRMSNEETITITVNNINRPPLLEQIDDQELIAGEQFTLQLEATDPDNDNLSFEAINLPQGATLNGNRFRWTPEYNQAGVHNGIFFRVNDDSDPVMSDNETINIIVRAPIITLSDNALDFGIVWLDEDADLTLTISNDGDADLHVTDISVDDDAFETNFGGEFTLEPDESLDINVNFTPEEENGYNTTLTITSNGNQSGEATVTLTGSCIEPEREYARDVIVSGNYAYVADSRKGFLVMDVSDPGNPEQIGLFRTNRGAESATYRNNLAYVTFGQNGLYIIDVSNPDDPDQVGSFDTPELAYDVAVVGNYAYVADDSSGLRIIDVSNPRNPNEVGDYDTPGDAMGVAVAGNFAYIADFLGGLQIIDVSDPTDPELAAEFETPSIAINLTVQGDYAYIAVGTGICIVDVSNPRDPEQVGFYETPGSARNVTISGHYAYVADYDDGMCIIDVSDPENPEEIIAYDTPGKAFAIDIVENYAYIADGESGLRIVDISPDIDISPTPLDFGTVTVGQTEEIEVTIANIGGKDLTISDIVINGEVFEDDFNGEFTLIPGNETIITVSFSPETAGDYAGELTITSNDPDEGEFVVTLTGIGANRSPVLSAIGALEIQEEEEFTLQLEATDPDNHNLSFEAENLPQGAILEDDLFSWTPNIDQAGVYEGIIFRVWDDGDPQLSEEETIIITVTNLNRPPVLSDIGNQETDEGEELTIIFDATDPDGDNLSYQAENLPEGATLNGNMFSWTPNFEQAGVYENIIIRVIDDGNPNLSNEDAITITVFDINRQPMLTGIGNQVVNENETLSILLEADDLDGDNLTFEAENLPQGATLVDDLFRWTPTYEQYGIYEGIVFRVVDDGNPNRSDEETIIIMVNNVNRPPVLAEIGNLQIEENEEFTLQLEASDSDGDNLSFQAMNLPEGATLEGDLFSWTPSNDQAGVYEGVAFIVRDDGDPSLFDLEIITITVGDVNLPPVLTAIGNLELEEGEEFTFQLEASDPDNDNLFFTAMNLPEGAALEDDLFSWTPDYDQAGSYEGVVFRVIDDGDPNLSDFEIVTIAVNNVNLPPVLVSIGNLVLTAGEEFTLTLEAADPDDDNLSFEAENLPEGSTLEDDLFSWTPDNDQAGDHEGIIFRVRDDGDPRLFEEETITITVEVGNLPPVLTHIGNLDLSVDEEFTLQLEATDPDDDNLTYEAENLPEGATLEDGLFSWTPDEDQTGVYYDVIFRVWDDGDPQMSNEESITITVDVDNHPPVLSGIGALDIDEGQVFTLQLEADDPDGDDLTFVAQNLPIGADLDGDLFSWTPNYNQAGVYEGIVFIVRDNGDPQLSDEETITITVNNNNRPPELTEIGNLELEVDQEFTLQLEATDPDDDDVLTFDAENLPEGATLEDGLFSWTPADDQVGIYQDVIFRVVDDGEPSRSNEETIIITVGDVNRPPVLVHIGNREMNEREYFTIRLRANDPDDDNLTYEGENLPEGSTLEDDLFTWETDNSQSGEYSGIIFRVWDDGDPRLFDEESITLTVINVNLQPGFVSMGDQEIIIEEEFIHQFETSDPDGDNVTIIGEDLPLGAYMENNRFIWRPTSDQAGEYQIIFIATDDGYPPLSSKPDTITVTVLEYENFPPIFSEIEDLYSDEAELIEFSLLPYASDPNEGNLTFEAENMPQGARILNDTLFNWEPNHSQTGDFEILFRVWDDGQPRLSDEQPLTIHIRDINFPPDFINISHNDTLQAREGVEFILELEVIDPDGDNLTYEAEDLPEGSAFDGNTFSWTPDYDQALYYYDVLFRVADDCDPSLIDEAVVRIYVNNTNRPPVLAEIGDQVIGAGEEWVLQLESSDPDPKTPQYEAENLPEGAEFIAWNRIGWTPTHDQIGVYEGIVIRVWDGYPDFGGLSDEETIMITVVHVNRAPVLYEIGDISIGETEEYSFVLEAADPDDDNLTFEAENLPEGSSLDDNVFSWTPTHQQSGVYENVIFRVWDDGEPRMSDEDSITIRVADDNLPPVLAEIGELTLETEVGFTLQLEAENPDNDNLTFEVDNLPEGATIEDDIFSWTPEEDQTGGYPDVVFRVIDDGTPNMVDEETINILVIKGNHQPRFIELVDMSTNYGLTLEFYLYVDDPDENTLTFEAENLPEGATLEGNVCSWTPEEDQIGVHEGVLFRVLDDGYPQKMDEKTITITVNVPNRPPVLEEISDLDIDEGEEFMLELEVYDPDGDKISFFANNLPEGAVLDSNIFTWTPDYDQAGVYEDVRFRIYDVNIPLLSDEETITITVNNVIVAPVLAHIDDQDVYEGEELTIQLEAFDYEGANLVFYIFQPIPPDGSFPDGSRIDGDNVFHWTPDFEQAGVYEGVTFRVWSFAGGPDLYDEQSITITVHNSNSPPVLSPIEDQIIVEEVEFTLQLEAEDPEEDNLTYEAENLPQGATLSEDGLFRWTSAYHQTGEHSGIIFRVWDDGDPERFDEETISITVLAPRIAVYPEQLDFEWVWVNQSERINLRIYNEGDVDLVVSDISVDEDDFYIGFYGEFTITPDDYETVSVVFAPETGRIYDGTITITSNDGQTGEKTVPITGEGLVRLGESARCVDIEGDYAYIADKNIGLCIIDISNPSNPNPLGDYETPRGSNGIDAVGDYAYLASGLQGLYIIDISNRDNPELMGIYDTPVNARDVVVIDDYAYVADDSSGLLVIDISDPENPDSVGGYDTPGLSMGITIEGNYAYIADMLEGLRIIDISDPEDPHETSNCQIQGIAMNVVVEGNYAYAANLSGLCIIDVSDPQNPELISSLETEGSAGDVSVLGDYAYLACDRDGLRIVSISDPEQPEEVKVFDTPGRAYEVVTLGNYAYIADRISGMRIIDISPNIIALPDLLDFGTTQGGETIEGVITITNEGGKGLIVSDIVVDGNGFSVEFDAAFTVVVGDDDSEEVTVTFAPDASGTYAADLVFTSNDPHEGELVISLIGSCDNQPPVLADIGNLEFDELEEFTLQLDATDPNGDDLTFEAENLPEGATLEGDIFSWTPDLNQAGVYENVIFRVCDDGEPSLSNEESITITIHDFNRPPVLSEIGELTIDEEEEFTLQLEATDPDGNELSFEAENLPAGSTLSSSGLFSWTPDNDQTGIYEDVIFRVWDDGDPRMSAEESVTIIVGDVNREPTLAEIEDQVVNEGEELSFQLHATDPDDDNLTFEGENLPEGATIEGSAFSWTPRYDQAGVYEDIIIRVWDDGNPRMSDEETIIITVNDVNQAPVLTEIGTLEIDEGEEFTLQLEANDPDDDNLTYEAENLPVDATLLSHGLFSWTPGYNQAGDYNGVTFRVLDDGDPQLSGEEVITITVHNVNRAPVLTAIGDLGIEESEEFSLQLNADDPDGDNLTYEAENLPVDATLLSHGLFSWTPDDDQAGQYDDVVFRVWDDGDPQLFNEESITITVINLNRPPVLTHIGNLDLTEGEEFILQLEANDPDGDDLTYEADNLPEGATLEGRLFSWTPDYDQAGIYNGILFRVTDDGNPNLSEEETITITVHGVNRPPVLTAIGNLEIDEGEEFNLQLEAFDPDGDNLTYEADNLPEGATLEGSLFSWTPEYDQAGDYNGIVFRVLDDGDPQLSEEETDTITVNDVNQAPVLTEIGDLVLYEGTEFTLQLQADDPDGDNVTYEAENLPEGSTLEGSLYSWTPSSDDVGEHAGVIFRVWDDGNPRLSEEESITITVNPINHAPTLTEIGNLELREGEEFTLQLDANDPDDDDLTFEAENLPEGATLEGNLFSWTPDYDQAGVYNGITFRVWDDGDPSLFNEETITITVLNTNRPPVLSDIGNQVINEGEVFILQLDANDPDDDDLTYEAENIPEGAILESSLFSWTPNYEQAGVYNGVIFRVWDNGDPSLSNEETISITVTNINRRPVLVDIDNREASEGLLLAFQLNADDPDGDNVTYEAENLPEGATLEGSSFSWIPNYDQAGVYNGITFRAWDDGDPRLSVEETITITVLNTNRPPVLSDIGNLEINEGEEFTLQLEANDPDGDVFTFEAENLPEGATLEGSMFLWTPNYEQAGVYNAITFRVWDSGDPSLSHEETISITVLNTNRPPVLADIGNQVISEELLLLFQLDADDPDGDNVRFEVDNLPQGATLEGNQFSWTPDYDQAGEYDNVTFRVLDDGDPNRSHEETITITVINVNRSPVLGEIGDRDIDEDEELSIELTADDPDDDDLTFETENLPEGATLEGSIFSWTPGYNQAGVYEGVVFRVWDSGDPRLSHEETITITVDNVSRISWLNIPDTVYVDEGEEVQYTVRGANPDNEDVTITYTSDDLPGDASFIDNNDATGTFTWQTDFESAGEYTATFTLSNGDVLVVADLTIFVNNVNRPPVLVGIGDLNLDEGEEFSLQLEADDPDGNNLSFESDNLPDGSRIIGSFFTWTPDFDQAGVYEGIVIRVRDDGEPRLIGEETITITVKDVNRDPVIDRQIDDLTIEEDPDPRRIDIADLNTIFHDPDGDELIFYFQDAPDELNMDIDEDSVLYFSPNDNYNLPGGVEITVGADDGNDGVVEQSFTLTITSGIDAPVWDDYPETVEGNENELIQFTVTGSDVDGDDLDFDYSSDLPEAAGFIDLGDYSYRFNWMTTFDDAGEYGLTINLSDGDLDAEVDITITIINVNRPPIVINEIPDLTINEDPDPRRVDIADLDEVFQDPDGDELFFDFPDVPEFLNMEKDDENVLYFTPVENLNIPEGIQIFVFAHDEEIDRDRGPVRRLRSVQRSSGLRTTPTTGDYIRPSLFAIRSSLPLPRRDDFVVESFTLTINEVNDPPVWVEFPQDVIKVGGDQILFIVEAMDVDGDDLDITTDGVPEGAQFNYDGNGTGVFRWETTNEDAGDYVVEFELTDGDAVLNREVSIHIDVRVEMTVSLQTGWNLISLNIAPVTEYYRDGEDRGPDILQMIEQFRTGEDEYQIISFKDGIGNFCVPASGFNNIPFWNFVEGYHVQVSEDCEGTWAGVQIPFDSNLPIREGWNIIPYFPDYELDASANSDFYVLSSIINNVIIAKNTAGEFMVPGFGFSTMSPWSPGQGFQIQVDEAVVLNYPEPLDQEAAVYRNRNDIEVPWDAPVNTGSNMSLLVTSIENAPENEELMIVALSPAGLLVGQGTVDENGECGFAVWGNDETTEERDGLLHDEAFELRLCNVNSVGHSETSGMQVGQTLLSDVVGQECPIYLSGNAQHALHVTKIYQGKGLIYETNSYVIIDVAVALAEVIDPSIPTASYLSNAYPNPFNGVTKLSYDLSTAGRITIQVFDLRGRLLTTLIDKEQREGYYEAIWDGRNALSGIYLVRMQTDQYVKVRKITLVK